MNSFAVLIVFLNWFNFYNKGCYWARVIWFDLGCNKANLVDFKTHVSDALALCYLI